MTAQMKPNNPAFAASYNCNEWSASTSQILSVECLVRCPSQARVILAQDRGMTHISGSGRR